MDRIDWNAIEIETEERRVDEPASEQAISMGCDEICVLQNKYNFRSTVASLCRGTKPIWFKCHYGAQHQMTIRYLQLPPVTLTQRQTHTALRKIICESASFISGRRSQSSKSTVRLFRFTAAVISTSRPNTRLIRILSHLSEMQHFHRERFVRKWVWKQMEMSSVSMECWSSAANVRARAQN